MILAPMIDISRSDPNRSKLPFLYYSFLPFPGMHYADSFED